MKRFSLVLSLVIVFTLIGASVALAAPGIYNDTQYAGGTYNDGRLPSGLVQALNNTKGALDAGSSWGLDNGLDPNANSTGVSGNTTVGKGTLNWAAAVKDVAGQRVHGEYTNDTNSCASCHQTHTGASRQLLMKNGIYNTCTACHDGTLGAYNVFAQGAMASNAGTFGGNKAGGASVHLATGNVSVSAAPGGDRSNTDPMSWGKDFTCASCHAPHGSYSERLLHYNPNMVATRAVGGNFKAGQVTALAGGIYTVPTAPGPWVFGYDMTTNPKTYWTNVKVNGASYIDVAGKNVPWNELLRVNYRDGQISDPDTKLPVGAVVTVDVAPATVVKMLTSNIGSLTNGWPILAVTNYVSGVNEYCAACHWDYATPSLGSQASYGAFSQAFRHSMKNIPVVNGMPYETSADAAHGQPIADGKGMVCLSCHFAHGTDNTVMKDAADVKGTAADVNTSSALKRYVNMAVCWKCHTAMKNEQLINNDAYWDKVGKATAPVNGISELIYP